MVFNDNNDTNRYHIIDCRMNKAMKQLLIPMIQSVSIQRKTVPEVSQCQSVLLKYLKDLIHMKLVTNLFLQVKGRLENVY